MGRNLVTKNLKGTVSIVKCRNRIRLRWSYLKKRYSLNLFLFTKQNFLQAKKIAIAIENDMVLNSFDFTLQKYKSPQSATQNFEKTIVHHFEKWVKDFKNMDCDQHKNYHTVRNMLKLWGDIKASDIHKKLNSISVNANTYNRRLTILKAYMAWLVKRAIISTNYLEDVEFRKYIKVANKKREPFTDQEILNILHAFKNDIFCCKNSRIKHSHYYQFVYFLFKTGVRNAEAVGLRVQNLHFVNEVIQIKDVLARSLSGSNASARIRKPTKNNKVRLLPFTSDLKQLMMEICLDKCPDDLVFLSPKGQAIDDKMFQKRVFSKVLSCLGIEPRNLYACRHTFGSRCIDQGISPVMTAFLMGNNPNTVLKTYTHQLSLPNDLPSITQIKNDV